MRFNLLPEQDRGRSQARPDTLRFATIGAWALTGLVVLGTLFHFGLLREAREEARLLRPRVDALRMSQAELASLRRANDELEQEIASVQSSVYAAENDAALALLTDIAASVPENSWLENLYVAAGQDVFADGFAGDTGELSRLLQSLRQARGVAGVELTAMGRVSDTDGPRREFSFWLTLEEGRP